MLRGVNWCGPERRANFEFGLGQGASTSAEGAQLMHSTFQVSPSPVDKLRGLQSFCAYQLKSRLFSLFLSSLRIAPSCPKSPSQADD